MARGGAGGDGDDRGASNGGERDPIDVRPGNETAVYDAGLDELRGREIKIAG